MPDLSSPAAMRLLIIDDDRKFTRLLTSYLSSEGYEVGAEFRELLGTLRRIRDEELEHLDHAVDNDAKQAVPHELLTSVIRAGCRGAIWISERV